MTYCSSVIDHFLRSGLKQIRRKTKNVLLNLTAWFITRNIVNICIYVNIHFTREDIISMHEFV